MKARYITVTLGAQWKRGGGHLDGTPIPYEYDGAFPGRARPETPAACPHTLDERTVVQRLSSC